MSLGLNSPNCCHVWSGEQTGKPAQKAGVHDEEPTVGTEPGNLAGEFVPTECKLPSGGLFCIIIKTGT